MTNHKRRNHAGCNVGDCGAGWIWWIEASNSASPGDHRTQSVGRVAAAFKTLLVAIWIIGRENLGREARPPGRTPITSCIVSHVKSAVRRSVYDREHHRPEFARMLRRCELIRNNDDIAIDEQVLVTKEGLEKLRR